jgi:tetratricopeptide (TPR) repeat protein
MMAGTRHGVACITVLLFICGGTFAAESEARPLSGIVADVTAKKAQDPSSGSLRGAARLPGDDEFPSAPKLFRQGRFAEAERQCAWIARVRKGTTWGERAQYYLAECQFQQKKYVSALESFERLHCDYPATEHLERLVSREYEIAQFWLAQSDPKVPAEKKLPWMARLDGRLPMFDIRGSALRALEHVEHNHPTGPLADDAGIQIADYYMERHEYETAAMYYDQFLEFYGRRKSLLRWRARLGAIEARIRGDLEPQWDVAVAKARELVEQILRIFPELDDRADRGGR